jgi:phosphoglycerate dehydrogenase-like enzyme
MKVVITATSFSEVTREPEERLIAAGHEIVHNPYGRPMKTAEVAPLLAGADACIAGVDDFSAPSVAQADRLKLLVKHGAGIDNIDVPAFTAKGIAVANLPGANAEAVADMALALMLAVARHIAEGDRTTKAGQWVNTYGVDLYRATVGLLGLGRIGKGVARRCRGFDARVLAYDPYFDEDFAAEHDIERADSIEEVMRESDFISIHMPSTPETRKTINAEKIALMKPTAILVNTARGAIVDEDALADALDQGRIFGAGLDVYAAEPPSGSRLLKCERAVTMPHVSSNTPGALLAMGNGCVDAVEAVFAGQRPPHLINPEVYDR